MKLLGYLLLVVALAQWSCSRGNTSSKVKESDTIAIRQVSWSYYDAINARRWDSAVSYIHPGLFKYMNTEALKRQIESSYESDYYSLFINNCRIDSVSQVIMDGADKYILVRSFVDASCIFESSDGEIGSVDGESCENFKQQFKEAINVYCYSDENRITFTWVDESYYVYLDNRKKWFAIGRDKNSPASLVRFVIPKEIRDQLKY